MKPVSEQGASPATRSAAAIPSNIRRTLEESNLPIEVATAIADRLEERDEDRAVLMRHGFVRCDIPACNCGSWHPRFGLTERMQEIKDLLAEAGHELSNENGHLVKVALSELIAERDALKSRLDAPCEEVHKKLDSLKLLSIEAAYAELADYARDLYRKWQEANRRAEYWKAEHLAGNKALESALADLRGLGGTTQEPVAWQECSVCGESYPRPVELHHDSAECVANQAAKKPYCWVIVTEGGEQEFVDYDPELANSQRVSMPLYAAPAGTVAVPREPQVYEFDRWRGARTLMAEGITVRANSMEQAIEKAWALAGSASDTAFISLKLSRAMLPAAPAATVAVPKEPTEAMFNAFFVEWSAFNRDRRTPMDHWNAGYRAMLAAAPAAPEAGSEQVAVTEEGASNSPESQKERQ